MILFRVQVLRAIAAIAVVVAHTYTQANIIADLRQSENPLPAFLLGAAGVDLFFALSGFVIVYSSWNLFATSGAQLTFIKRRLIRILPLYWFAITITIPMLIAWSNLPSDFLSWQRIVASYLFIPYQNTYGWDPITGVGWTLNFEMFFYACFAAFLPLRPRVALPALCTALILYSLYGRGLPLPQPLLWLTQPFLLEFAAGAAIGFAYCEGLRLPRPLVMMGGLLGMLVLAACAIWDVMPQMAPREIAWGLPCVLILIAAVHAPEPRRLNVFWKTVILLGDASYAIYLLHGIAFELARAKAIQIIFFLWHWPWLYTIALTIWAVVAATAFHLLVERPVTKYLRARIIRRDFSPSKTRFAE